MNPKQQPGPPHLMDQTSYQGLPGVQWTPGEAAAVNEFLSSPVGRKWLAVLAMRKPKLSLIGTEQAALTGAFAAGYEAVFAEIAASRVTMQQPDTGPRGIDPTKD